MCGIRTYPIAGLPLCLCALLAVNACCRPAADGTAAPDVVAGVVGLRRAAQRAHSGGDTSVVSPLEVFGDIGEAWRRENASELGRHFGETPIRISFSRGGPRGGRFSRTQAEYALRDHFHYTIGESFEFVEYRDGDEPLAVAERTYRVTEEDTVYRDQVNIRLVCEGDRWVVSEIEAMEK